VFVNGSALAGASSQNFGSRVAVWAVAEKGYSFKNWSSETKKAKFDNANSINTTVTLDSTATITANFVSAKGGGTAATPSMICTLSVATGEGGNVSLDPEGTAYPKTSKRLSATALKRDLSSGQSRFGYMIGTQVTVRATPNLGYTFTGWSGASSSKNAVVTIMMDGNKTLTAVFEASTPVTPPGDNVSQTVNGYTFEMVPVAGGTFTMGCTSEQGSDCWGGEEPAHDVTLSGYYIGKYEVTQGLWKAVMGSNNNPSYFTRSDNLPVERVSWNQVKVFIDSLNRKTGKTYRLPTEAEWEYAARGGNNSKGYKYSGSDNIDNVAWYVDNNTEYGTKPVGTKSPNELGIYDMSGNVWEWVSDWYGPYSSDAQTNPTGPTTTGTYRVIRGGSWYDYDGGGYCRVSSRSIKSPDFSFNDLGFRLALLSP